jgi:DNA-binding transcriptional ArsR family regulator
MDSSVDAVQDGVVQALREAQHPIVTVPDSTSLFAVVEAVSELDVSARLLINKGLLDHVGWPTLGVLRDLTEGATEVRVEDATTLAVVDQTVATVTIDDAVKATTWIDHDPSPEFVDTYTSLWRDATEKKIDAPKASAVRKTVSEVGGEKSIEELRRTAVAVRGEGPDPLATVLWCASADSPTVAEVAQTATETFDVSRRTVERRITRLTDDGLLAKVPADTDNRGRPPNRLVRAVEVPEGPLDPVVRKALQI